MPDHDGGRRPASAGDTAFDLRFAIDVNGYTVVARAETTGAETEEP